MLMYEKDNTLNIKFNENSNDLDNPDLSISNDGIVFNGNNLVETNDVFKKLTDRTIESIVIPDSVTSIGASAFNGCTSLTNIIIPDSVTSIGSGAFSVCTSLENIIIPDSVTSIEGSGLFNPGPFVGCTSLKNISISKNITQIPYSFASSCTALESVVIPDGVTTIGDSAFYKCTSLDGIVIPSSVTSIGSFSFKDVAGTINCEFSEGDVSGAPWGATGTIVYDYTGE